MSKLNCVVCNEEAVYISEHTDDHFCEKCGLAYLVYDERLEAYAITDDIEDARQGYRSIEDIDRYTKNG